MNIDIKNIVCFGFTYPKSKSWLTTVKQAFNSSWKYINQESFQKCFNENVLISYENLIRFQFIDVDSSLEYSAIFDNKKKSWKLQIPNSPDDAVSDDDIKAFLENETFKKICKRADIILSNGKEICEEFLMHDISSGKFIEIDEFKFEAILSMLNNPELRKRLKTGKYV